MKISCYGDSNTWGYDPRGYFGGRYDYPWPAILAEKLNCSVCNWGINGRKIPTEAVEFSSDTDLLILMLGTNDLLEGASPEAACHKMEQFLKSRNLNRVLLIAPPVMKPGAWVQDQKLIDDSACLAKLYQSLAKRLGVRFADAGQWNIPLAYDGVHLSEEGHRVFAERLTEYLEKENELCWKQA
ncbi:MAG: lipase [Oscillospiraceae bacterium]|nr:lipase [Oscillospiraceae bacterium]